MEYKSRLIKIQQWAEITWFARILEYYTIYYIRIYQDILG